MKKFNRVQPDNFTGEQIKKLRNNMGLSQAALGEAIGLGKSAIGMYERGERRPDQNALQALADCFNVSISQLVDKSVIGDKTKTVVIDGLSEAEIGFITQFHLLPPWARSIALHNVEASLKAHMQSLADAVARDDT